MHVKKGDTVVVISGKDKGKTGKILEVNPTKERVIVEGVNMVKKHQKPTPQMKQAGIIEMEAPIHASKVMIYDSKTKSGTRIRYKKLEDGKKVRVSVKSGEVLD
ncbi:50S ribosomal protein L24 [Wukongibacter sp. M2B1]|uniref:50S ribosomal protein L24 n=1 Tax=Wukongibacter sp. M2B1 TaxID=3088895 RepID=UPI003D79DD0C